MPKKSAAPPEIKTFTLDQFFSGTTYEVPAYQRNYSWGSSEVKQLVDDLLDFFDDNSKPYYLLGDVIVVETRRSEYDLEIIDGQQRITTLMILFSVLYRRLAAADWDQDDLADIRQLVYRKKRIRVRMSGDASVSVLEYLNGENPKNLKKETPSQKALIGAIEDIETVLNERFGEGRKHGTLHDFFEQIVHNVYLSRLWLHDNEAAFEFFERVNDRGRPLSKTDLLKNRLLQKIKSDADYEAASDTWSEAEKRLMPFGREGSMPYLLRLMIQAEKDKKVKDSDLFRVWKGDVSDDASCQDLIDRIDAGSKALAQMLQDKTPQGEDAIYAHATNFMRFTQNHGPKLAAAHLNKAAYDELARRLEARAILSLLGLERSQNYENLALAWSHKMLKMNAKAKAQDIIDAIDISESDIAGLLERARLGIRELRYGKTPGQTKRLRLLLAIVNYELFLSHPIHHYDVKDLLTTSRKIRGVEHPGYDIEHVSASSRSEHLGDLADSVGNLTLFFSQDNRSKGNKSVERKAENYANSILYGTQALSAISQADKTLEKVISPYRVATVDHGEWGLDQIEARTLMYFDIFESYIKRVLPPTS
jgi:hypothetical protein